jgi:hypothetical protein
MMPGRPGHRCEVSFEILLANLEYVPLLALIGRWTLDFRESECLFRGPEIPMRINNYKQSW